MKKGRTAVGVRRTGKTAPGAENAALLSPSAVFFDAGGTLFRPRGRVGEIYTRRAADFGVRADATEVEKSFRRAFAAAPPLAFPDVAEGDLLRREQAWWREIVRSAFAEHAFADFEAYFQALYEEFVRPESWDVFPDVVPVLERLRRRGHALGIVSNFDARLFPLLRGLGLAQLFDSVTISSSAGYAKPDARIFERALQRHGVAPPDAVHVGDSEVDDVGGARAAGLDAILVRSNGSDLYAALARIDVGA